MNLPSEETMQPPTGVPIGLGDGFDYPFANLRGAQGCVEGTDKETDPIGKTEYSVSAFSDSSTFSLLVSASTSAHLSYLVGHVDAGVDVLTKLGFTSASRGAFVDNSYIYRWRRREVPKLSQAALEVLNGQGVKAFRQKCGTHFIQALRFGGAFRGSAIIQANSQASETAVQTKLAATVFDSGAKANAEVDAALTSNHATLKVRVDGYGLTPGSVPSISSTDSTAIQAILKAPFNLVGGTGAVQEVIVQGYSKATVANWPDKALGLPEDDKIESLTLQAQALDDAIAKIEYARSHPRQIKGLWSPATLSVVKALDDTYKTLLANLQSNRDKLLSAIKSCRQSLGATCTDPAVPKPSASQLPVQFDYECPADVSVLVPNGGAGTIVKGSAPLSLKQGDKSITEKSKADYTLEVKFDAGKIQVRHKVVVTEYGSGGSVYEGTSAWMDAGLSKSTPLPDACQFFDSGSVKTFNASLPYASGTMAAVPRNVAPSSGPISSVMCVTDSQAEPDQLGCMMLPRPISVPVRNKQDLISDAQLKTAAQAAESAQQKKIADDRKKIFDRLTAHRSQVKTLLAAKATAPIKVKLP